MDLEGAVPISIATLPLLMQHLVQRQASAGDARDPANSLAFPSSPDPDITPWM